MHIPLSGVILLPLIVLVVVLRPARLEELTIYMAVFQGASVLNLGGTFAVGLLPYFATALVLGGRVALRWSTHRIRFYKGEFAQLHLQVAALFIAWCVASAFLLPFAFDGIPVDSPRAGTEAVFYTALPLRWTFSNAGQAGYMVLDYLVLLAIADQCLRRGMSAFVDAFTNSGLVVLVVGIYQMVAFRLSLPFPAAFFNSNDAWGQNYNQMIGEGWHRVSATFVEPSAAGGFLSGWVLFELILATWGQSRRTRHLILAVGGCVVLLATASTTGYLALALVLAFMTGRLMLTALRRNRILIGTAVSLSATVLAGVGFLTTNHAMSLLDAVVWHKADSSSAVTRFGTIWRALDVMQTTYGLGAGLGSNRAFGIIAYIGSNLGIVGIVLFIYLLAHLLTRTVRCARDPFSNASSRIAIVACATAFCATLIGMSISGAEISSPQMWVLWAMMVASLRNAELVSGIEPA